MDIDNTIRQPQFLPGTGWATEPTFFAPYWCIADNSYSKSLRAGVRSHVWYHVYKTSATTATQEQQMLKAISSLVESKYRIGPSSTFRFQATWALVATWERISPYPSTYKYQVVSFCRSLCKLGLHFWQPKISVWLYAARKMQTKFMACHPPLPWQWMKK